MTNETWDRARPVDLAVAARQLGRALRGRVVAVAKRCSYRQPQVLVTYPLVHEAGAGGDAQHRRFASKTTPFPTIFWLTCPHMRAAISSLESRGMIEGMRRRLREDDAFAREYQQVNRRYAAQRAGLLDADDRAWLQTGGEGADRANLVWVISESGVGGLADWAGVKCLHMNMADYMAGNANPVGELCAQRLAEDGLGLECADGRCVPIRVAAINAGSNSAKALVADVVECPDRRRGCGRGFVCGLCAEPRSRRRQGRSSHPERSMVFRVASDVRITGLGRELEQTGLLSEEGCARTAEAIGKFAVMARELGATRVWATATAAARRALELGDHNGVSALRGRVRDAARVELEVIPPELEAELSFAGVLCLSGPVGDPRRVLVVDSGGMSTEFIRLGAAGVQSISLPFGSVSLTERFVSEDPPAPGEIDAMRDYIRRRMQGANGIGCARPGCAATGGLGALGDPNDPHSWPGTSGEPREPGEPRESRGLRKAGEPQESRGPCDPDVLVVVGGTAATLVSVSLGLESFDDFDPFDYDRAGGVILSRTEIESILARFVAVPYAERSRIRGMIQPERALVMPAGTAVVLGVMDTAGVDQAVMSFAGILDGMAAKLGTAGRSGHAI